MRAGRLIAAMATGALGVGLAFAVPSSGQLPGVTTPTVTTPTTPTVPTVSTPAVTTPTTTTPASTTPTTTTDDPPAPGPHLLALGITTPISVLAPFGPGQTATAAGVLAVTSTSGWTLTASDDSGDGHLQRSGSCSTGTSELAQPLSLSAAPGIGSSTGAQSLGPTDATLASGAISTTITTDISQSIGAAEPVTAGCAYSATITFTLS